MKKFIIAANWKMNKTVQESTSFISDLDIRLKQLESHSKLKKIEIVIFPPYTSLYRINNLSKLVSLGSQNIYFKESGAFTGEISVGMVADFVNYSLVGHSERRKIFGEIDEEINLKIKISLKSNLSPMLCIGETLDERESGTTFNRIGNQLRNGLKDIPSTDISKIVFAYEPVWAIGTGMTATPEQAQEVHDFITNEINEISQNREERMVLYGGSVKPENSIDLLSQKNINGALIGGASLNIESFFAIIQKSLELV